MEEHTNIAASQWLEGSNLVLLLWQYHGYATWGQIITLVYLG